MSASNVRVRDIDHGWKRFVASLKGPQGVRIGLMGAAQAQHEDSPYTVAEVGSVHEFGLGVPERSFLRAWFDSNDARIDREIEAAVKRVANGKITLDQMWNLLGQRYVAEVQARIVAGIAPPLAESTVQRKGSSTSLVDTGQLKSAITYELIQRKGAGKK